MRPLRPLVFVLVLVSCLCVHLHAQNDASCKAPGPASDQTKEQQDAASSGYLAACRAATASDAHELEDAKASDATNDKQTRSGAQVDDADKQTRSGAQVDEAVNTDHLALPHNQAAWKDDDYLYWIEQQGCPKLRQQAKKGLAGRPPAGRTIYLASIVQEMKKQNKCY
jgi:hypothetical protein